MSEESERKITKVIIVQECSGGNEEVGNQWIETKIFFQSSTLREVLDWKNSLPSGCGGRTIITVEKP